MVAPSSHSEWQSQTWRGLVRLPAPLAEREPLDAARGVGLGEREGEQDQAGGRGQRERGAPQGEAAVVRRQHRGAEQRDPEQR